MSAPTLPKPAALSARPNSARAGLVLALIVTCCAETTEPQVFTAGVADVFIAGTAFAVLTLLLVVFAVRPPKAGGAGIA